MVVGSGVADDTDSLDEAGDWEGCFAAVDLVANVEFESQNGGSGAAIYTTLSCS